MSNHIIIEDLVLNPFFIKIVNSAYEVHKKRKDKEGKEYTKFVSSSTDLYGAMQKVCNLKITQKNVKAMTLRDYLVEIREMSRMLNEVARDDKLVNRVDNLFNRVQILEDKINK